MIDKIEQLHESCPRGLDLVFYLFQVSKLSSQNLVNYSLALYLFKTTLKTFFR